MARKNSDLPGMVGDGVEGQKPIPEIDEAAEGYVALRDKRIKLLQNELSAKDALVKLMNDNKLNRYVYDDHVVELMPGKAKLKVKEVDSDDGEGDED